MSTSSRLDESQAKLGEIADRLDSFFCEDDPILLPSSTTSTSDKSSENSIPGHKKRSRRHSSNGTKRRSKDSVTSDSGTGSQNGGGLDRLVDFNIDPSFLDLLEDELPIVTFDDTPPDTMEIIDNYDQCTSINPFNRRKKKSLNSSVQNPVTSTMAETNLLDKNSENSLVSPSNANSTILRRLLETPETKAAERAAKKAKKANNLEPEEDPDTKPLSSPKAKKAKSEKADDSISECETASIA